MRFSMRLAVVLTIGFLFARYSALCQTPPGKATTTEVAKKEGLQEQAQQIPLQSLVAIKQADGRTYRGRLVEMSRQGIVLQIMMDSVVDNRSIAFEQLRSIRMESEPKDLSTLGTRRGLFQAPQGSLIQLRLTNGESPKGLVDQFLDDAFVLRIRDENSLYENKLIYYAHVRSFSVKVPVVLGALCDPEAFKTSADSAGAPISERAESPSTTLWDGTPIIVRLGHTISTMQARAGDPVDFEIVEGVRVGQRVVLPKGGTAFGTIAEVVPKRRMGRGARIRVEITGARTVTGGVLPLRATKNAARASKVGDMTATMVGIGLLGMAVPGATAPMLLIHGADTAIPRGTLMVAYVPGDTQIP